jgi:hypothetical protein
MKTGVHRFGIVLLLAASFCILASRGLGGATTQPSPNSGAHPEAGSSRSTWHGAMHRMATGLPDRRAPLWEDDEFPETSPVDIIAQADDHDLSGRDTPPVVSDYRITFNLNGSILKLPYYRNLQLGEDHSWITRAVVVIHGIGRNAQGYSSCIEKAADSLGVDDHTIVIAPHFLTEEDVATLGLSSNVLYWITDGWVAGDNSGNTSGHPRPATISSYSVVDSILLRLAIHNPNLEKITVVGHSAGGQFTNRYSLGNRVEQTLEESYGIAVSYVVANPSSYVYLDGQRWAGDPAYTFRWPSADSVAACSLFNTYRYGLDGLTADHYMGRHGALTLIDQFRTRRVIYLLGTADTLTEDLDTYCQANYQGRRRYDRGIVYQRYLAYYYGPSPCYQMGVDVPGGTHDKDVMFRSKEGSFAIFDYGTNVDVNMVYGFCVKADGTGDQSAILRALMAGSDGVCVGLTDGTYTGSWNTGLSFGGKKMTVISISGLPDACVIDCRSQSSGASFLGGEDYRAGFDGVTIENGSAPNGAGISCTNASSPTIHRCVLRDNHATNDGGGLYCTVGSDPTVEYCLVIENRADDGGGMYAVSNVSTPNIRVSSFANNAATANGGGFYGSGNTTIFDRVFFTGNSAGMNGGGAYFSGGTPCMRLCFFAFNTAGNRGAGLYAAGAVLSSVGTTYASNNLPVPKSGLEEERSAIYLGGGTFATFSNSIIAFTQHGASLRTEEPQGVTLSCSDLYGNELGDWVGPIANQLGVAGNISMDPLFCDVQGGDYHLQDGSPCAPHSPQNPGCELVGTFPVGCPVVLDYADETAGNCSLTVTDQGILGFMDATQTQGNGFVYPAGGENRMFVGSLWIANSPSYVANRDYDLDPSREWNVCADPDGHVSAATDGQSDRDMRTIFDDGMATGSLGVRVRQETWGFAAHPNDDFVIVRYLITNTGSSPLTGLYAGLFADIDIGSYMSNHGAVEDGPGLVEVTDGSGTYVGVRLLAGERGGDGDSLQVLTRNLTLIHNPTYVHPNQFISDADKFAFLSAADPAHILRSGAEATDYGLLAATGPMDLGPGEMKEVPFAIVGGSSHADFLQNATAAQVRYLYTAGVESDEAADGLRLLPAGPNPSGGAANVKFTLPRSCPIRLEIFDVTGRLVRTLADGVREAGQHTLRWDGVDENGRRVPSGVYFVRLSAETRTMDRRLVLLR